VEVAFVAAEVYDDDVDYLIGGPVVPADVLHYVVSVECGP
jgi:hypothetical protein